MKQAYRLYLKHRQTLHAFALHAAVFSMTAIVVAMYSPFTGEVLHGMMMQIGFAINVAFAAIGMTVIVALFIWNFGKGIQVTYISVEDTGRMLGPGRWTAPDISPDVLICMMPGESLSDFAARADQAIERASNTRWAVVVPYRNPVGMIYSGAGLHKEFTRDAPPFVSEGSVVPAEYKFTQEGEREYQQYLNWFAEQFREWSANVKITQDTNPGSIFRKVLQASVAVFALLFAAPAFAQSSTEQVANVIKAAGRANEIPAQGSQLEYDFDRKTYFRRGNGVSGYVDLLKAAPNFRDNAGGNLIRIVVDGEQIAKQYTQPVQASAAGSAIPVQDNFTVDSTAFADRLTDARQKFDFYKSQFWQGVKPTWDTVMYFFWGVMPLLLIAGLVLWFWAKLSASEELPDIHWRSSRALVVLVGLSWTVLIINATMTLISWEPGPVGLVCGVAVIAAFAFKSASWVVPNLQAKPGGRTSFLPGNYNNRQLPG